VDGFADLALVAIGRRGVDVAVSSVERDADGVSVSSGGVWKTPRPSAGSSTPLLSVMGFMLDR